MMENDLKAEVKKLVDRMPPEVLEELYAGLKELSQEDPQKVKLSHNLNKILKEDKKLLERLAK